MANRPKSERFNPFFRGAGQYCGVGAAGLGGAALIGWAIGQGLLTSIRSDFVPMPPDTALALVVLGLGLIVVARKSWWEPIALSG
jgi:hypothetical protein